MTSDDMVMVPRGLQDEARAAVAEILEIVARDGLPGPRDLDAALDAIGCAITDGAASASTSDTQTMHDMFKAQNDEIAFLTFFARSNIPTDVQELLVRGNPDRGIRPNVLRDAIITARKRLAASPVPPSPPRDEVVEALRTIPAPAIDQLRHHQTQLDMDGIQVGVSRQAIEEVLAGLDVALSKLEERS